MLFRHLLTLFISFLLALFIALPAFASNATEVDRVIVSAPPRSLYDAFDIIQFGGIITYFGLDLGGKNNIELDVNDMIYRKITLIPTFAAPAQHFPRALSLLKDGYIDSSQFITHRFPQSESEAALRGILEGTLPAIKGVMLPDS